VRRLLGLTALAGVVAAGALWAFARSDAGVAARHELGLRLRPYTMVMTVDVEGSGPLRLFLDPDDKTVTPLMLAQGIWEANETHWFAKALREGDVVVDVGANIGWYTLIGARLVGETGRVYAFEPDPAAFALLSRNVRANGLTNVVLEQKAVSDAPGTLRLYVAPENKGDHRIYQPEGEERAYVEVPAVTLDDYFRDRADGVDFVKVDTQGAELVILQGMRELIGRSPSLAMVFEFAPYALKGLGGTGEEMLEIFRAMEVDLFDLGTGFGGIQPLHRANVEALPRIYRADDQTFTNLMVLKARADLEAMVGKR
jgi:FkbM family methyltransferase